MSIALKTNYDNPDSLKDMYRLLDGMRDFNAELVERTDTRTEINPAQRTIIDVPQNFTVVFEHDPSQLRRGGVKDTDIIEATVAFGACVIVARRIDLGGGKSRLVFSHFDENTRLTSQLYGTKSELNTSKKGKQGDTDDAPVRTKTHLQLAMEEQDEELYKGIPDDDRNNYKVQQFVFGGNDNSPLARDVLYELRAIRGNEMLVDNIRASGTEAQFQSNIHGEAYAIDMLGNSYKGLPFGQRDAMVPSFFSIPSPSGKVSVLRPDINMHE